MKFPPEKLNSRDNANISKKLIKHFFRVHSEVAEKSWKNPLKIMIKKICSAIYLKFISLKFATFDFIVTVLATDGT